MIAEH